MAIFTQSPLIQCLLLAGVISLAGCGGGGGGSKTPAPTPDTTPNAYSYTATTNAELSAVVTSAAVTISGIDTAAPVTITGGEYSIAGGAFTSAAGTVTNGQTITIRVTAPAANSTSASAQLTVGGVAATFTVTTKADSTPNAFTFTAQTNAALNTEYTSNTITLAGIDTAVPISITGGTYSINGGAFTSAAGTVSVNNTIAVKGTSTGASESTHNVVLTIGGVSATYSITTIADTTPPVAEFKFPTPYTMSEANTVKVRGTATDDNAITNLKVVVRSFKLDTPTETLSTTEINATPKAETNGVKDFSSWTVDVPLTALAENEIKVIATDNRNNAIQLSDANKVVIRQADVRSAFPDEDNQFAWSYKNLLIDNYEGRNRILIVSGSEIFSIDPLSGQREKFFDEGCYLVGWDLDPVSMRIFGFCDGFPIKEYDLKNGQTIAMYNLGASVENYSTPSAAVVDRVNGRAQFVIVERTGEALGNNGRVSALSIENKTLSVIVPADQPSLINVVRDIIVDGDRYLVPSGSLGGQLIGINALTGVQTIVSDNSIGDGDTYGVDNTKTFFSTAAKDNRRNKLFIMEEPSNRIFVLDLATFHRKILGDLSYRNADTSMYILASDLALDEETGRLYLLDDRRQALLVIDSETGEKSILSKSVNDF